MDETPNNTEPIWGRIEALMKLRGMNQKELAAKMGVTPTTVTDWKTGKSKSYQRLQTMLDIAKALGMTVEGMFPEWGEPNAPDRQALMQVSADEMALIERYRQFNQEGKTQIQNLSESMLRSGMYEPGMESFLRGIDAGFDSDAY